MKNLYYVLVACLVTACSGKLIFPVTVMGLGCVEYIIRQGTPTKVPVMTKCRLYPERQGAWLGGCRLV